MATGAAGDGLFRNIFEGCIGSDMGIQRRPYHRNCSCALHKNDDKCPHASRGAKVSYPIRRTWSEGNLVLMSQLSSRETSPASVNLLSVPVPVPRGMVRAQTQTCLLDNE